MPYGLGAGDVEGGRRPRDRAARAAQRRRRREGRRERDGTAVTAASLRVSGDSLTLAELVVWHSRPFSPTRRLALGESTLPTDPPPGFGGILLGGGRRGAHGRPRPRAPPRSPSPDQRRSSTVSRIVQPRLRHRFQTDRVGLSSSHHRLLGVGEAIDFDFDTKGSAAQQMLGAVYAAAMVPAAARHSVATVLHKAMRWTGPLGPSFVSYLSGVGGARAWSARAFADPVAWALEVLGIAADSPDRQAGHRAASARACARCIPTTADRRTTRVSASSISPKHGGSCSDDATAAPCSCSPVRAAAAPTVARRDRAGGRAASGRASRLPVSQGRTVRARSSARAARDRASTRRRRSSPSARIRANRLVLGGRSMGGRICSMAVADGLPAAGLVLISLPAASTRASPSSCASSTCRARRCRACSSRARATRSARPTSSSAATATIPGPVEHVWIEGGRHELKGKDAEIAAVVARWIKGLRKRPRPRG